ncbi:outer membrane beta-barrel family protein [Niabella hibiscisoli]|uniref:outer membrane beta-barrel family protein n=1 Tax=Niabella hibiscisoli TaxID=1825928 RepID=UPI001F10DE48|nr:outer membrane beta-barrel family protein [Niabella hibiscisoli]MCH5714682.1 outer membrane beta-barrel family protein [Niabella hibiscisoli]
MYDFWNDDENQVISERKTYPLSEQQGELVTRDIESSKDIYVQSNLVLPISKGKKLEAGVRADLRALRSDYRSALDSKLLDQYTNKLYYNENIYSAYIQLGDQQGKFSYLLGLRSELTDIRIFDRKETFDNRKNYLNPFPTLHIGYLIDSNVSVQLSYSRRINRPQFSQLNTFGGLSDTRNLTIGNPDLDPMYADSYEIGILSKTGKWTLSPTLYYKHSTQNIEYALKETQPGYLIRMPFNLDNEDRMGIELAVQYIPFKWWRLMLDANYFGFRQKGDFENKIYRASGQTWLTRLTSKVNITKVAAVDLGLDYQSGVKGIQTYTKPVFSGKLGAGRDFRGDKFSLNLTVTNLFNSKVRTQITQTDTYYVQNRQYWPQRQIIATLTYRFNRKKGEGDRLPGS